MTNPNTGIRLTAIPDTSVIAPAHFTLAAGGDVEIVQLVDESFKIYEDGGTGSYSSGGYVLDSFGKTVGLKDDSISASGFQILTYGDSPGNPTDAWTIAEEANEHFVDYVMYKPAGGIWVTLEKFSWQFVGNAFLDLESKTWQYSDLPTQNPAGVPSYFLPQWTGHGFGSIIMPPHSSV